MEEVYVVQLTCPTTCYSAGLRCQRFASESHALLLVTMDEEGSGRHQRDVISGPLPNTNTHVNRIENHVICVGHDACDDESRSTWELFVLMERKEDGNSSSTPEDPSSLPSDAAMGASSSSLRASTSSMDASMSSLHISDLDLGFSLEGGDEATRTAAAQTADSSSSTSNTKAWLVLQKLQGTSSVYRLAVSFRPLAPNLCVLSCQNSDKDSRAVVFVGSADDSRLRCYTVVGNNSFETVELPQRAEFQFSSPVMAIESHVMDRSSSRDTNNDEGSSILFLAIGCQDGTIRLLQMDIHDDGLQFSSVRAHTVIVDGPIMVLSFYQEGADTIHVAAGSMCGFVCRLSCQTEDDTNDAWKGPWMVSDALWDTRLDAEDPVLAVHFQANQIAAGTQSGQCYVWEQTMLSSKSSTEKFHLRWHCQLIYPIRGVRLQSSNRSLQVTTRRTMHVFRESPRPHYSADLAKRRLLKLLEERGIAASAASLSPSVNESSR